MRFLLLAAILLPVRAGAAWWVQDQFIVGSRDFIGNKASAQAVTRRGLGLQAEHSVYSHAGVSGAVHGFMAGAALVRPRRILTLRGLAYPEKNGAEAFGGVLRGDFLVHADRETHTQASLGVSGIHQQAVLAPGGIASFNQFGVTSSVQQTYFRTFQIKLDASGFLYDRSLSGTTGATTFFDQKAVGSFSALRPVTPLPRWALAFQVVRRAKPGMDANFFAGYGRTNFAGNLGDADSVLVGMDLKPTRNLHFDLSWNWWNASTASAENYFAILARLTL